MGCINLKDGMDEYETIKRYHVRRDEIKTIRYMGVMWNIRQRYTFRYTAEMWNSRQRKTYRKKKQLDIYNNNNIQHLYSVL